MKMVPLIQLIVPIKTETKIFTRNNYIFVPIKLGRRKNRREVNILCSHKKGNKKIDANNVYFTQATSLHDPCHLICPVFSYQTRHRLIYHGRERHLRAYNFPPVTPISDSQHPKHQNFTITPPRKYSEEPNDHPITSNLKFEALHTIHA